MRLVSRRQCSGNGLPVFSELYSQSPNEILTKQRFLYIDTLLITNVQLLTKKSTMRKALKITKIPQ